MFSSLQNRFLTLLIIFAVAPALLLGISLGWYSATSARQRVEDTLTAVATLKEAQINSWLDDLLGALENEIRRDADTQRIPILLREQPESFIFSTVYNEQVRLFNTTITTRGDLEELFIISSDGRVIVSTNPTQEDKSFGSYDVFRFGRSAAYIAAPNYDFTVDKITLLLAQPIKDSTGQTIGVMAGRANLSRLNNLMQERTGIGQTGETYLVSRNLTILSQTRQPGFIIGESYARTYGAEQAIFTGQPAAATYLNYAGQPVIGSYRYLSRLQVALLAEQGQTEAFANANLITNLTVAALVVSITIAILAAFAVSNNLTRPIIRLTTAARQLAGQGSETTDQRQAALRRAESLTMDVDQSIVQRQDEIGALGQAFQTMTLELRQLIGSLETRVEERTRLLQNRGEQLQAAAEVSRTVATILDTDQLIQQVVDLIQTRFDLYYVGLFLTDPAREWAVLKAGTGQAGVAMLSRSHRIKLGAGMIGWSIVNAQPRVALQAGEDAVRLATPDLPDTRSEAAIPLRSRGQVLGAITVQSRLANAFDNETIAVFQTMADQIAVAIDNARLFAEAQKALDSVQQAYGRMSHQAWLDRLSVRPILYKRDQSGMARLEPAPGVSSAMPANPPPESVDSASIMSPEIALELKARGQVIGRVRLRRPAPPDSDDAKHRDSVPYRTPYWSQAEISLLQTILDQLGASLDSARLFEETQQQAQRERLVGEITANMRATLDIDNVLQTAAREMLNALNLAEVEVRLSGQEKARE